jgi:tetratricopeptide (TPR) repeat protein
MYGSRCFQASAGKMGCISCHDPHFKPAAAEKVSYFRERCLSCHQEKGCALAEAERRKQQPDDSCAACHMPRLSTSNVAHTALSDHRILRRPDPGEPPSAQPRRPLPGVIPISNFFEKQFDREDPKAARDLGVALVHLAQELPPMRTFLGQAALPLLENGLQAAPQDVVALESKGFSLAIQGRTEEAQSALDAALRAAPMREITLSLAAQLAQKTNRPEQAIAYLRRAVEVNPWEWEYRFNLAQLLAGRREWDEAWPESDAALRLNPFHEKTRTLFITCSLHTGRKDAADREFAKLVALTPPDEARLRSWFADQERAK